LPELIGWLRERGYEPLLDEEAASILPVLQSSSREMPASAPALVIVLGGDGTLLSCGADFCGDRHSVMSVNLATWAF